MKLSVILPCLNEESSIGQSIEELQLIFIRHSLRGEIIVVDNGSTDNSAKIAKQYDITYILEPKKGYGNAYLAGFKQTNGQIIIMVDPDASYDFNEIPSFLRELKNADCIIGSRYLGQMEKGAMPFSHKYIGNPIIRLFLRINGLKIKETSTGFVGIKKEKLDQLNLKQSGMEFSSEFLVKANKQMKLKEIPINYYKRLGKSKIKNLRDGLRHIFFLVRSKLKIA